MSRTFHHGERRIRARGIRQDPPDLRRVARTLIALAEAQAEADAQAQTEARAVTARANKARKPRDMSVADHRESA
jgi:hypothetical protein